MKISKNEVSSVLFWEIQKQYLVVEISMFCIVTSNLILKNPKIWDVKCYCVLRNVYIVISGLYRVSGKRIVTIERAFKQSKRSPMRENSKSSNEGGTQFLSD